MAERFWEKVEKSDGCWNWRGARNPRGYGKLKVRSYVTVGAHRVSYALNVGPIAPGLFVCHRCDNPSCVRPEHLFLGTCADNNRDMQRKKRHPGKGSTSHCPKGHLRSAPGGCRECDKARASDRYRRARSEAQGELVVI